MASTCTYPNECAFPVEIFDLIIKELTGGERSDYLPTLKACCLVSKPFVQLCRPVIFESITYGPFGDAGAARTQFAHLFTANPLLGTYVKSVKYLIRLDNEPAIDEKSVRAEARKRYKLGSIYGERGSLTARGLPMSTILSAIKYRHYMAMGGRMDDFQFSLSQYVPNVESLFIVHQYCHDTPADASYPCDNRYCHEFTLLVLEEFGDSARKKLTSLSMNGIDYIPAWHTLKFPNLSSLELVRLGGLSEWNRPADMDDDHSDNSSDDDHDDHADDSDDDSEVLEEGEEEEQCVTNLNRDAKFESHCQVSSDGTQGDPIEDIETIDERDVDSDDSDWETVDSEGELRPYATLPGKLKHLKIDNVTSFSFNIVQHLPLLETVYMKNVEHYTSDLRLDKDDALTSFDNLHTLITDQLHPWDQVCEHSATINDTAFPSLKVLDTVVITHDDIDTMNTIFDHVEVIETLTMTSEYGESGRYHDMPIDTLQLGSCFSLCSTTLKHVTINWHHQGYDPDETVIATLCEALDNVEGDNVIESITVDIDYDSVHIAASNPKPMFREWRRLDSLLTHERASNFPRLRNVSIKLWLIPPIFRASPDSWVLTQFLRKPLRKLHRTTDLNFTCRIEHITK